MNEVNAVADISQKSKRPRVHNRFPRWGPHAQGRGDDRRKEKIYRGRPHCHAHKGSAPENSKRSTCRKQNEANCETTPYNLTYAMPCSERAANEGSQHGSHCQSICH